MRGLPVAIGSRPVPPSASVALSLSLSTRAQAYKYNTGLSAVPEVVAFVTLHRPFLRRTQAGLKMARRMS